MVMDTDFTGGLRWTLAHAGTTTSTSEDMLQYNWEFDDRTVRAVLRDVDVEKRTARGLPQPLASRAFPGPARRSPMASRRRSRRPSART